MQTTIESLDSKAEKYREEKYKEACEAWNELEKERLNKTPSELDNILGDVTEDKLLLAFDSTPHDAPDFRLDYNYCRKSYTGLSWYEFMAIVDYIKYKDSKALDSIILHDNPSTGMRRFIADLALKRIARPPDKKASTYKRDYQIFKFIEDLKRKNPKQKLRTSKKNKGVDRIVAEKFDVGEESAIKIHSRIKKEGGENFVFEVSLACFDAYSIVRGVVFKD